MLARGTETFSKAICVGFENKFDLIPNFSEGIHYFGIGTLYFGRVNESPVVAIQLPRIHWAGLVRIPANGNDRVDVSI